MKIRDPKTGNAWGNSQEAGYVFCRTRDGCENCPLNDDEDSCKLPHHSLSEDDIRAMGYEVIHSAPHLCVVLGVEVKEAFTIDDRDGVFFVDEDGMFFRDEKYIDGDALCYVIEHPEKIHRLPRWTEDDIADAKAIRQLWPQIDSVRKIDDDTIRLYDCNQQWITMYVMKGILNNCKIDELVKLDDIIGEDDHGST